MKKIFFFCILLIFIINLFSEQCIKVIAAAANIRMEKSTNSTIIAVAKKNDVFILVKPMGQWYEIKMFSGEYRYIYKTLCSIIEYDIEENLKLLTDKEINLIMDRMSEKEDLAMRVADSTYDVNKYLNENIDYNRQLIDKYKLDLCRNYNIQPPIYKKMMVRYFKLKGY